MYSVTPITFLLKDSAMIPLNNHIKENMENLAFSI